MGDRQFMDYEVIYNRFENAYKKYKNCDTASVLVHAYEALEGCALAGFLSQEDWLYFANKHYYYYAAAKMRYIERIRNQEIRI